MLRVIFPKQKLFATLVEGGKNLVGWLLSAVQKKNKAWQKIIESRDTNR
jgi:hypothetical protein